METKACACCGSTGVKLVERKSDLVCQLCDKLLSLIPGRWQLLGPVASMIGFTGNWIAKGDMEKQELLTANLGLQSLSLTMYRDAAKFAKFRDINIDEIFSKDVLSNFEVRQEGQSGLPH